MSKFSKHNSILDTLKNIRSNKRLRAILIACIMLVVVCFIVCAYHVKQVSSAYKTTIHDSVVKSIEMTERELASEFMSNGQLLEATAATLGNFESLDKATVVNTLITLESSGEFDRVVFIRKSNSIKYKSDGTTSSIRSSDYDAVIDDFGISTSIFRNFASEVEEEISFGTAVKTGGVTVGYLVGSVSANDTFKNAFSNTVTVDVETMLFDKTGSIISIERNGLFKSVRGENFYVDYLRDLTGDEYWANEVANTMQYDSFDGDVNTVDIEIAEGGNGQIIYSPLGQTGWMIAGVLQDDDLDKVLLPMLLETLISVACMVVIVIMMIIIMGKYAGIEQAKIHELTFVDTLTDAPNETAFKKQAAKLIHENMDSSYMIACFDIVNFRYINEGYGHDKADKVLQAMSSAMLESLTVKETFARIGADRFVCLVLDDGREDECVAYVTKKLNEATANLLMNYPIRVKTGIYYVTDRDEPIADMIDKANLARKAINSSLRGTKLRLEYQDSLLEDTRKQEQIESCMETALINHEFVPFLQPKWNMKEDHIYGAEALVRWVKSDGTVVPPGDFIPLFEKNGFIEKIDFFMLDSVCAYLRKMIDENREVYPVSINQSRFLMYDPDYLSRVQDILLKYKIPKGLVELELTETVFFHEKDRMLDVMKRLKDFNMELSIDDFGSGYSSLNLLRDIPFDVLKIDRGFLDESSQSETGKWILRKIVEMAEGLHLRVICEGVETQEHVDMLLNVGCVLAQGFLYSKPIPIEQFIEKYNLPK